LSAGRFAKAKARLTRAEGLWPGHPTANFYLGDAWRKLRNPVLAAKRYDRVAQSLRTHVPALNNCACLAAQVKDYRTAVGHLARALRRDPENETVVNNAWEIMHMLSVDKQGPGLRLDFFKVARADLKTLEKACLARQKRMQAEDKFRWGSGWVSGFEYKTLRHEQREADRRLKELQGQIKVLGGEIRRMENRLDTLARMRNQLLRAGSDARLLTFHREAKELQEEIRDKKNEQAELVRDAKRVRKGRPEPKWSGDIVLLGIDSPIDALGGTASEAPSVREAVLSRKAVLVARDGTFLGRLTADRHDTESIWNPLGKYGSPYSEVSIFDPTGRFGGPLSDQSPWNPKAEHPPMIKFGEEQLVHLTANPRIKPGLTVEALIALMKQMP
ncbi:MAG: tetratricopeptide repeat protein, partial [Anaerolineaceae bacterium]|nr:tetratricopeptide repeat protein [Anaerolineaceae bacterium]